jgi:hypothetical protein
MSDDADDYQVRLVHRMRVAGMVCPVGSLLSIRPDRLRVAAWLVKCGAGRPFDARTARDVELHQLLDEVLPK